MAWTVAFALAGALLYSMFLGPVLASLVFPKGTKEWRNPLMSFLTQVYGRALGLAIRWRWVTAGGFLPSLSPSITSAPDTWAPVLPPPSARARSGRGTPPPRTAPTARAPDK